MAVMILHRQADRQEVDDFLEEITIPCRFYFILPRTVGQEAQTFNLSAKPFAAAHGEGRQAHDGPLPRGDDVPIPEIVLASHSSQHQHALAVTNGYRQKQGGFVCRDQICRECLSISAGWLAADCQTSATEDAMEQRPGVPLLTGELARFRGHTAELLAVGLQDQCCIEGKRGPQ